MFFLQNGLTIYYHRYMAKKERSSFPTSHIVIIVLLLILIGGVLMMLKKSYMKSTKTDQSSITSPTIVSTSFNCDESKTIQSQFYNNQVELELSDGRTLLLAQALSGSGVRYTNWDESVTFWTKGNTAFIEEGPNDTTTYANCVEKL